jgi:hypothetical protein
LRKLQNLGHDARLMPAKYVRPYSKGQKNDFRDAEAIAEAVQRPTMRFIATKTADQLDLQALHRKRWGWCASVAGAKPMRCGTIGVQSRAGAPCRFTIPVGLPDRSRTYVLDLRRVALIR